MKLRRHKYKIIDNLIENKKPVICFYCNTTLTPNQATVDHIVPRSQEGADTDDNFVLACLWCNLTKNNKVCNQFDLLMVSKCALYTKMMACLNKSNRLNKEYKKTYLQ